MNEYKNMSLEELNKIKEELENEKELLNKRRADVDLYQKLYEKYNSYSGLNELRYGKLCNHPDYYTKWRNTFFDKYNRVLHGQIHSRYATEPTGLSINQRKAYRKEKDKYCDHTNNIIFPCENYDICCKGVGTYDSLIKTKENMYTKPVGKDLDRISPILGFCDAVKEVNGKYQLHLTDPSGGCTFPPFDITAEEAELALGRICIVSCVYNFFAAEPKLWELQILPYTLTEKLGEYETDTVIIERDFPIKPANFTDYF